MPSNIKNKIAALNAANTEEDIRSALAAVEKWDTGRFPDVQHAIRSARDRMDKLKRFQRLTRRLMAPPLPNIERQTSHQNRLALLADVRGARNLGLDMEKLNTELKNNCYDTFCKQCEESPEYATVCLQFMLECLAVRIKTRLDTDAKNGYFYDPKVTAFMQRFVTNPLRTWVDETAAFYTLPDQLDTAYNTVVLNTTVGRGKNNYEKNSFKRHIKSIRKMIESIKRCDIATEQGERQLTTVSSGAFSSYTPISSSS